MIDSSIFIGLNGAKQIMQGMEVVANNLANVNTKGFRADLAIYKTASVEGGGQLASNVYSEIERIDSDFSEGASITTNRNLDVAINGDGWIAVQTKSGKEAYTRAGNLQLTPEGLLTTTQGHFVLGNEGIVALPPSESLHIGSDGTVSIRPLGQNDTTLSTINRIKLVKPDNSLIEKREDGLFYIKGEGTAQSDASVRLSSGVLEGSNVNVVQELVQMIQLSRDFEVHSKLMNTIDENAQTSNKLLSIS